MDAEAEYLIQEALEEVLKGRTALGKGTKATKQKTPLQTYWVLGIGFDSRGGLYSQLYRRQMELAAVGQGEAGEE